MRGGFRLARRMMLWRSEAVERGYTETECIPWRFEGWLHTKSPAFGISELDRCGYRKVALEKLATHRNTNPDLAANLQKIDHLVPFSDSGLASIGSVIS
jgi:hypothetical protein